MKRVWSVLLATLLLLSCIPLSVSAACGIAGHRVIEPTCIEEGYCRDCGIVYAALGHRFNEMGICEYCGEKKEFEPSLPDAPVDPELPELPEDPTICEHEWTIGATREPTCMEDGLWEYYCTLCYERMVEFLPATGEHLYDENGYCEYCGKQEEPDECRHEWQELMFIEPTCVNEGVWERYCTLCYRREVEFFPANGIHIYDDDYDPECNYCGERREVGEPEECHHEYTDDGFCIHCGAMVEVNPDLPCTHKNATQPTCTTDGVCFDCGVRFSALSHVYNEMGICENCGERIEIDLPCTHENSIPSTCTEYGFCYDCGLMFEVLGHQYNEKGICNYCGDKNEIEEPEECHHEWLKTMVATPTCIHEGVQELYCPLCGRCEIKSIPATGEHVYDDEDDAECNYCGEWREVKPDVPVVPDLPCTHEHGRQPTCTEKGYCFDCGLMFAPFGHMYNEMGICDYCGEKKEVEPDLPDVPVVPDVCEHEYVENVLRIPTCNDEGLIEYYCVVCGYHYTVDVPATGEHTYDDEYDEFCNVCGGWREVEDKPVEPDVCHHEWVDGVMRDPTCVRDGVWEYYCILCFERHVETIPATGVHEYDEKGYCIHCGVAQEPEECHHEWQELMFTEPTCINEGVWERYCTLCYRREVEFFPATGEHVYDDDADPECNYCGERREIEPEECHHEWLKTMIATPTCIHEGAQELYCPLCGRCELKSIPATGEHVYDDEDDAECNYCGEWREVKPDVPVVPELPCTHEHGRQPTCTEKGYCFDCGLMFAPFGHMYNEMGICDYCGEKQEIIPDLPDVPVVPDVCEHEYVENVLRIPTCNDEGLIEYYCVVCGYHYTVDVPVTGEHTYDDEYDEFCNVCGGWREVEDKPVEPDVCHHEWVDGVMKDPTCFSEGIYERYCILCYERHVEILPATGEHVYSENGICEYCGEKKEIEPDLPDVPVVPEVCEHWNGRQPTCIEEGYCFDCGMTFAPFGHMYNEMGICDYCGEKKEVEPDLPDVPVVPEVCEHEYEYDCSRFCALCGELTRPDASCVEYEWVEVRGDGVHVLNYECRYCHEPLRGYAEECYGNTATCHKLAECVVCGREYGDYANHDYHGVVTAPTCTTGGYTTYTCATCGDRYVGATTASTGHDYAAATCTTPKTCKVCGATDGDKLNHRYDNGVVTKAPTCTGTGLKTYTCTACGDTYTESIAKVAHDYAVATCTAPETCKVCGATDGEALGHDYETKTTKATTTKDGVIKKICKECGYTASKQTTIYKASKVTLSKTSYTYNGKVQKPTVTVKDSKGNTISSSQYTVTYPSGMKNAGTYSVKVTFKGNYSGTKTLTYKINPIDVSKCKISLSATTYTYTGGTKKPTVTVKNASGTKLTTSSYTVTYASGLKNVGTYKVTVKMKGNYTGTKTLTFKINPAKTSISKLTGATKALTVAITKKLTQVTGYEVQYSTSKSFASYKSKTVTSYKTTSVKLTGLKAKTTYYVRVRTYKTVNGKKYYSEWSTVKYTKTK